MDGVNEEQIKKIDKFETEDRLNEIDFDGSLKAAGFSDGMTLADIGSGTGVLIFEARKLKDSKIYSVEMSEVMIGIQEDRISSRKIENIEIINQNVDRNKIDIEDNSCDVVSMITVLHEIGDKESIMDEISRILKPKGRLLIVEFNKEKTSFGPPLYQRLSGEEIEVVCGEFGFKKTEQTCLGDNFYRVIFEKQ